MARPTTKTDLVESADINFQKLLKLIDSMTVEDRYKQFAFSYDNEKGQHWSRDKNCRDVIVHLFEWHQLLINWMDSNLKGIQSAFLLEGYNWRNYGEMNQGFWDKHQNTTLEDACEALKKSHITVFEYVKDFSNDDLFSKGAFEWTKGSTLGSYIVSSTSSHYEWAIKKIKKHIKSLT